MSERWVRSERCQGGRRPLGSVPTLHIAHLARRRRSPNRQSRFHTETQEVLGREAPGPFRRLCCKERSAEFVKATASAARARALSALTDSGPKKERMRYSTASAPDSRAASMTAPSSSSNCRQYGHCGSSNRTMACLALGSGGEMPSSSPGGGIGKVRRCLALEGVESARPPVHPILPPPELVPGSPEGFLPSELQHAAE
jgi:hypothetical protein